MPEKDEGLALTGKERLEIALEAFGTDDGVRPSFPRRGEAIQEFSFRVCEAQLAKATPIIEARKDAEWQEKLEAAVKAEGERIIPPRYAPLADFTKAMIDKMEAVTPEYGDWFEADLMQIWRHLVEEYDEWNKNCQDHTEVIDLVNCLFMLWCNYKKPNSWQALKEE